MSMHRKISCATALAIAALVGTAPAPADQAATPAAAIDAISGLNADAPLPALVEALDHDLFAVREHATELLRKRARDLEAALGDAVRIDRLTPEQSLRIEAALKEHFWSTPRAGLGVSFMVGADFVTLDRIVENFPAVNHLRPGDVILSVDGVTIGGSTDLMRQIIFSHHPGEPMRVSVLRNDKRLDLEVPLGDYASLGGSAQPVRVEEVQRAWNIRRARLGLTHAPPRIVSPQPSSGWPVAEMGGRPRHPLTILPGGHSVPMFTDAQLLRAVGSGAIVRQGAQVGGVVIMEQDERALQRLDRRTQILIEHQRWQQALIALRQQLDDPNLTEDERRRTLQNIEQASAQIDRLREQLRALAIE